MGPRYHTPPTRSTKTYKPCKGVGVFVKNKTNINKSNFDLKAQRYLSVSTNLIIMNICKVSPKKKAHMIKSGFRGKPYVLCLKNVEIEPLRTYVVISLELSA